MSRTRRDKAESDKSRIPELYDWHLSFTWFLCHDVNLKCKMKSKYNHIVNIKYDLNGCECVKCAKPD